MFFFSVLFEYQKIMMEHHPLGARSSIPRCNASMDMHLGCWVKTTGGYPFSHESMGFLWKIWPLILKENDSYWRYTPFLSTDSTKDSHGFMGGVG